MLFPLRRYIAMPALSLGIGETPGGRPGRCWAMNDSGAVSLSRPGWNHIV
jgi:hypothetical protein